MASVACIVAIASGASSAVLMERAAMALRLTAPGRMSACVILRFFTSAPVMVPFLICFPVMTLAAVALPAEAMTPTSTAIRRVRMTRMYRAVDRASTGHLGISLA